MHLVSPPFKEQFVNHVTQKWS